MQQSLMVSLMLKLLRMVPVLVLAPAVAFAQGGPQNLTNTVNGNTVTLAWSGGSGNYIVEASLSPGGSLIATLPVSGTGLVVPGVPSGVYFVRVRDVATGAVSNEVTVTVSGGCPGVPLPPTLIVRSVGFQATVSWSSSGGCAPTSYTMLAGSAPGLSDVVVVNAGSQLGLQATAPPGVYYVRVVGTNQFGSAVSEELTVRVAANAQTDTVAPNGAVAFDVAIAQNGVYTGTLVWNDATIDLDLYLTSAGCPYPPTGCLLAISDAVGVNTEAVSKPVAIGETYRVWVDNISSRTTSFTIFNTVGAGAALTADDAAEEAKPPVITKVKP